MTILTYNIEILYQYEVTHNVELVPNFFLSRTTLSIFSKTLPVVENL